jgi:hypothetical protein
MQKTIRDLHGFVLGGDFNTNPDQAHFVAEKTLGIFGDAGFSDSFGTLPPAKRITDAGKGRSPDETFDYLFFEESSGYQCPRDHRDCSL